MHSEKLSKNAEILREALQEDHWEQDVTCRELENFFKEKQKQLPENCEFVIVAKQAGVFSGSSWMAGFAELLNLEYRLLRQEGEDFLPGDLLVVARASPLAILRFERTLLNGLQIFCGVATRTRRFVEIVETASRLAGVEVAPGVFHTRKTTPLLRSFQLEAVLAGGGALHRSHLEERVLVKENHKYLLGEQRLKFDEFVDYVVARYPDSLIEVETVEEALAVMARGARHLMLDNFSPDEVKRALKIFGGRVEIEISGGLNETNISKYVLPGVQRLSVGSLTHGASSIDLSLDWKDTLS